jgi:sec-independent protein translocase protein TatB
MEIFGIGWQELLLVAVIALIVLGPQDMQKAGRTIGRWLNQLVRSDGWKVFQKTSGELRNLPRNLMREANLDIKETEQEIRRAIDPRLNPPASSHSPRPPKEIENTSRADKVDDAPAASEESRAALKGSEGAGEAASTKDSDEHV